MTLPSICYGLEVYQAILIALGVTGVVLRFVALHNARRSVAAHDFLTVSALVGLMGYAMATMVATVNFGYGYHVQYVSPSKLSLALKVYWAVEPFWAVSTVSFRIAILLLYVELFRLVKTLKYCAYVLIGIVVAYGISCIVSQMLFCRPIHKNWHPEIPGSCDNALDELVISAAINMVLDVVIVALPLPVIWNLQMSLKKKIGVSVQFSIGLLLCGINVGRIIIAELCPTDDVTYCAPGTFMLSASELALGIWAACLPTLGQIFGRSHGSQNHSDPAMFPSQSKEHKTINRDSWINNSPFDPSGATSRSRVQSGQQAMGASSLMNTPSNTSSEGGGHHSIDSDGAPILRNGVGTFRSPEAIYVRQDFSVGSVNRNTLPPGTIWPQTS